MNMHSIRKIDVQRTCPTVRGQVIRKWYESISGVDGRGLMLILRDDAGDCIEIRAFGNLADKFGRKFREYDWYNLKDFVVVPIDDNVEPIRFSLTRNPRRLYLTPQSQVNNILASHEFDEYYTPFDDLRDSVVWSGGKFVNLMGVVLDVGKLTNDRINFRLVDMKGSAFKCFAKGICALQIQKISGKDNYDAGVCILRFCFATEEEGDVVIAADRAVSEILVNPWTKPALELRSRMRACLDEYMLG